MVKVLKSQYKLWCDGAFAHTTELLVFCRGFYHRLVVYTAGLGGHRMHPAPQDFLESQTSRSGLWSSFPVSHKMMTIFILLWLRTTTPQDWVGVWFRTPLTASCFLWLLLFSAVKHCCKGLCMNKFSLILRLKTPISLYFRSGETNFRFASRIRARTRAGAVEEAGWS